MLRDDMVLPLRMRSLGLGPPTAATPADVGRYFLAIQGQDFAACLWALAIRSGASIAEAREAFDKGHLVRTWPMRGTLHVVPAEDAAWLNALRPFDRTPVAAQRGREYLELPEAEVNQVPDLVRSILGGGRAMTRHELFDTISERGVVIPPHLRTRFTWYLVKTDVIVLGPTAGREHLCVLAEEWIKDPISPTKEEAAAKLAARFVASHGPATDRDLARWTGLGLTKARSGLRDASDHVVSIRGESGQTWWVSHDAAAHLDAGKDSGEWRGVRLLPAFDEHIIGYADRSSQLAGADEARVCPGRNGVFKPSVVKDGVNVGTWNGPTPWALEKTTARRAIVEVTPFDARRARNLPKRALATAARQYADYLGADDLEVVVQDPR